MKSENENFIRDSASVDRPSTFTYDKVKVGSVKKVLLMGDNNSTDRLTLEP